MVHAKLYADFVAFLPGMHNKDFSIAVTILTNMDKEPLEEGTFYPLLSGIHSILHSVSDALQFTKEQ